VPTVPTQRNTYFDEIKQAPNVGISPNSASHDRYNISMPKKGDFRDEFFDPKKIN
jgi:hypothetical protein